MAEPWEWKEEDLLTLVSQQATEAINLDFKECAALDISTPKARDKSRLDLSKDVSAFANSVGGSLVYGIVEQNHVAGGIDTGYDANEITKEWIEQVINSNIQPRVPGLRINPVQLLATSPGKVAYVIYVPQGTTAHQASDKRYYKRFNFQSVPMEDYEIRDVMHRVRAPRLRIEVTIGGQTEGFVDFASFETGIQSPQIEVSVLNEDGADAAEYSQHQIFVPSDLTVDDATALFLLSTGQKGQTPVSSVMPSDTTLGAAGGSLRFSYFELHFAPGQLPLFPGERRELVSFNFRVPRSVSQRGVHVLLWRTRAPRSEPSLGAVVFQQWTGSKWHFGPMTVDELQDQGLVVRFAP
jgi:hypothetical protein